MSENKSDRTAPENATALAASAAGGDDAAFAAALREPYQPSAKPVPMSAAQTGITSADLENLLAYHAPKNDQVRRYAMIRAAGLEFAKLVVSVTPRSPQQTLAIRAIKQASALANEAIAVNE